MKSVLWLAVGTPAEVSEVRLPAEIGALSDSVGTACEGLLVLSLGVKLRVVRAIDAAVAELVGPKGDWNPDRAAASTTTRPAR